MRTFLGEGVSGDAVASGAQICGQTLIEGSATRIAAGAHIENSYLRNVVVAPGARIVDSVITAEPEEGGGHVPHGFAARWAIRKSFPATIGERAEIQGCTLVNASVGAHSVCREAFIGDSTVGPHNRFEKVYAQSVDSGVHATVIGPTEVCAVWLGHHAVIDRCGFFEGSFINDFYVLEFDKAAGTIVVKEILDVPHTSRYGLNTINSSNSGNLRDPAAGVLRSLGRHIGLWQDRLLSHEPIVLGPCCWVAGWTKVIGKSARAHATAEEFLSDSLATNLLPFSVSGLDGSSVTGQVTPGELHNGLIYKQRHPAWAFTCAPGAVIGMVQRVAEASGDTALADRLVELSLRSALALVQFYAHERGVDLDPSGGKPGVGWTGWLVRARRMIEQHIESGLWRFRNAEPVNWRQENGRWVPRKPELLTAIAPDALEKQYSEEQLLACEMEPLPRRLGASDEELAPTTAERRIDPAARVARTAYIGPGVQIRGNSVVEEGAWLYRAVVDNSTVGRGARVTRSSLSAAIVGEGAQVLSCRIAAGSLAPHSTAACARLDHALVEGRAQISPYAGIEHAALHYPCIVGSNIVHADVGSVFMSYHMPGQVEHLIVEPSYITRNGQRIRVEAIPMLGGGLRALGTAENPVRMECAFIGSNAILEAGAFVGFGSFVLGRLTGAEGLPPFTISTAPGPERDEIGMVVHRFANVVITHFVNWAFQALGPERAPDVALLVPAMLREGRDAVAWALKLRREGAAFDLKSPYAKYKSLALYTEGQLAAGLEAYETALADGRWEMAYQDGELRFTGKGEWVVKDGAARWQQTG